MQKMEKTPSSVIFRAGENISKLLISSLIYIVLARLLSPSDYGVIALLNVFIAISKVIVESGLSTALMQKKQVDNLDYDTSLSFSLGLSLIIYLLLFLLAPTIAGFYNKQELSEVLRVLGLLVIPSALNCVLNAKVARDARFKDQMLANLYANAISGAIGICFAYLGFKYWALAIQQLSCQLLIVLFLGFRLKYLPKLRFSVDRIKSLIGYGWKLLMSGLIDVIYESLKDLFIGKRFNTSLLGYYNKGRVLPELIMGSVNHSIQTVIFPKLSSKQDDLLAMKSYLSKALKITSYIMFPFMIGLSIAAKPAVSLLLGEKWLPSVIFIQICCFNFALYPLNSTNLQSLNALGRSDLFLKLELFKKLYGVTLLVLSIVLFHSVEAIAISVSLTTLISVFVNSIPNSKILGYGIFAQLRDILSNIILSLAMGIIIYPLKFFIHSNAVLLLVQIILAFAFYVAASIIFKISSFYELLDIIKSMKNKN